MIKFILFLLISQSAYSINIPACATNGGDNFKNLVLLKDDAVRLKAYQEECFGKKIEIKEAKEIVASAVDKCTPCFESYGSGIVGRGKCKKLYGCSYGINFLSSDLKIAIKPLASGCEEALFCSEETSTCEYICDEGFNYNKLSGFCERTCTSNEIYSDNTCSTCPEGKVPNSEQSACVCSEGKEEIAGVCTTVRCPGVQLPSMTLTWYYPFDGNLEAKPRARESWAVDYGDYNCGYLQGPSGFNGNFQVEGAQYSDEPLPTTIRFLYPDIRNYTVSQLMSLGNDLVRDTSSGGMLQNCKHKVTGASISLCDPAQENMPLFNHGFNLRSTNIPTMIAEPVTP